MATIVRPVTAEARKGRSVTRTCVTIPGYGGARSTAIHQTITHGVRADDPDTRSPGAQMPAFGKSGVLTEAQIADVAEYVLSLSGRADDKEAADARRQDLRRHVRAVSRSAR